MPGITAERAQEHLLGPPSIILPPTRTLNHFSIPELSTSVSYLRKVYTPQVRGTHRRLRKHVFGPLPSVPHKIKTSPSELEEELDALRNDAYERSHAINWLTSLIAHLGMSEPEEEDDQECSASEVLLQEAASILATCSGTAGAGVISRTFSFPSPFSHTAAITINLKDVPLENNDYGSVGAQTWGGACVMAGLIAEDPKSFGFVHPGSLGSVPSPAVAPQEAAPKKLRILELGAGTGLVSLTTSKLMHLQNRLLSSSESFKGPIPEVETHVLDWSLFPTSAPTAPLDEPFDVILGADIIYEAQHARWIKSCLEKLLRKPSASHAEARFHLIIPLRATHALESGSIEAVFPYAIGNLEAELELVIKSKDTFICDAGDSGKEVEEVEYAYYQIGWGTPHRDDL
ncbi:hypothetical protein BDQ17DRAFT_1328211 [Cyathus striatus]|nr:hypothetical protein BDQ17DRAFT_1328211 [Cyathus striatus]